jgi:hypothetical protein
VKQGEDGGVVVRLFETEGKEQTVSLQLFGKELQTKIRPHQLKTLNGSGEELDLMEWALR